MGQEGNGQPHCKEEYERDWTGPPMVGENGGGSSPELGAYAAVIGVVGRNIEKEDPVARGNSKK
jgi:hypothetical protein